MRGRVLACLVGFALPARAGPPSSEVCLVLPEGQSHDPWVEPLDMAGLRVASGACEATVELQATNGTWKLRVTDAQGTVHEPGDAFDEPRTEEARERLVWLVYSLLHPVEALTLPTSTRGESLPVELDGGFDPFEAPLTVSEAEQWVEAAVASLSPQPVQEAPPAESMPPPDDLPPVAVVEEEEPPAEVSAPAPAPEIVAAPPSLAESPSRMEVWARTSAAVVFRGGVAETAEPWLMAGVATRSGRLLVGAGGGYTGRRSLDAGEGWFQRSTALAGGFWWRPGSRDSGLIGLLGGVSDFAFTDGEEVATRRPVPWLALEAGVSGTTGLGRTLRVEIFGRVQRDFVDVNVSVDGAPGERLSPWSTQLGLALVLASGKTAIRSSP